MLIAITPGLVIVITTEKSTDVVYDAWLAWRVGGRGDGHRV